MKIRNILCSVTLLPALLVMQSADAAIVNWTYSGTITTVEAGFTDLYAVGDSFSGQFTYDSTSAGTSNGITPAPGDTLTSYDGAVLSGSITIGDYSLVFDNASSSLLVINDFVDDTQQFLGDGLNFSSLLPQSGPLATDFLNISFMDSQGSVFDSAALPDGSLDTSLFDQMSLLVSSTTNANCDVLVCDIAFSIPVEGVIDSVSVSAVPLPAAAWLFISGLLGFVSVGYRRRR